LEYTGLEPRYLELELTETAVMRNFDDTTNVLQSLSAMGIRIAVDDFGTGYSNLSYLKRFPINTLKLDKSFVHDIPANADIATIVRSVIHMGQSPHLAGCLRESGKCGTVEVSASVQLRRRTGILFQQAFASK
jgi:EAL domain-containing protein (putative c-di-GMP-specific phosphodiesterase class I)